MNVRIHRYKGNADSSQLQSHMGGYIFSGPPATVPGEDALPSYPTREQMLNYFQAFCDVSGVTDCLRFNCNVVSRSDLHPRSYLDGDDAGIGIAPRGSFAGSGSSSIDGGGACGGIRGGSGSVRKVRITYTSKVPKAETDTKTETETETHRLDCDYIFACPGRVNRRRELQRFPGEATEFQNRIAYGSGQDLDGFDFARKRIVILGHGSFAIENVGGKMKEGKKNHGILHGVM